MNKNLLIVLISVLCVGFIAHVQAINYAEQGTLVLEANVLNLGYSPDQKVLVVLTNGTQGQFAVYNGIRPGTPQVINIIDGTLTISPSTFAFSQDSSLLVIGSKQGSVYGFQITNGQVSTQYQYKYNIQTDLQFEIFSISISPGKKIAIGTSSKLVVLQVPADASNTFTFLSVFVYNSQVSSVAWKNTDENSILVGILATVGNFEIYHLNGDPAVQINTKSTSSIGVFADGRVLHGKVSEDIEIFKWNDATAAYQSLGSITNTVNATQIIIDSNSIYFGAQIKSSGQVLAWKIDALTEKNLQNTEVLTLPTEVLNQTGNNLALSGNGNQILVVTDATATLTRYNLCNDGSYYAGNDNCVGCENGCQNCFDANTCISCPTEYYITADNTCASCHDITPGCKTCTDVNTCTLCDTTLHRKQAVQGGLCVCDDVSYAVDVECKLCIDNIDFCQSCSDANTCTTCYPDGNINPIPDGNGKCICLAGWYLDTVCKDCPTAITGCKQCSDAQTCTLCNADESFQSDGKGGCQCAQGKWYNTETLACQLCETKVPGCLLCAQNGQCITCSEEKRVPNTDKTQCICQPYTFENPQKLCQDCDPYGQCLTCISQTNCTICDTTKNRALTPVNGICLCNKGFVENDATHECIACTVPGCEQCNAAQSCDLCFVQKHFQQTPQSGACVCETNYHLVDNQSQCWTCSQAMTGCTDCDNLKECKQCDDSANFELNQNKTCQCKASYYEQSEECKLCSAQFSYCQNCNKDSCIDCQNGFSFNEQEKKCYCPDDRDFDETAGTCEEKAGLSALAIIAIIVGILALAGGAVAIIKCFKKRQSPLEDGEYEALEGEKDK